jgi:transglutaminase-like putative cysteine protease
MKLKVTHRTRYVYSSAVRESFNEARLRPTTNDHQTCENFLLRVLPAVRLKHYNDLYSNVVHYFDIAAPHDTLDVESTARVVTRDIALARDAKPWPLARVAVSLGHERCFDFTQPSHYVENSPELWRLALDVTSDQDDVWQASLAAMDYVHREFKYDSGATNVHTRVEEVLAERRGVCQDFAHVLIGLLRSIGIPALYVSGYLYNGPRDQLLGSQASHAWCEVFLPGLGWRGLDPTNNQPADARYIKLGVGRDYADVPPLRGHYKGTLDRTMIVDVLVERLDDTP